MPKKERPEAKKSKKKSPSSHNVTIYLTPEEYAFATKICLDLGLSLKMVLRWHLMRWACAQEAKHPIFNILELDIDFEKGEGYKY